MRDFFKPGRSTLYASEAMVATSHPNASVVALDVLRSGGSAMDAAIAAAAVQCVVDPLMTGIGGDCFVLYTPAGAKSPVALNGSGRAPLAANLEWYRDQGIREIMHTSPHSVTIPGALAAWARLNEDFGTRPLADLLKPAIQFAEEGYRIQPRVSVDWKAHAGRLSGQAASEEVFIAGGTTPRQGDRHRQPKLARTLRKIAKDGWQSFYLGELAEEAVKHLRSLGGLHTLEDFAATKPEYVVPIQTKYRGFDVFECPPNGQGLAVLMMLNVLETYDLSPGAIDLADRIHLLAEVNKQAYKHRDVLFGDPDFSPVPSEELLASAWARRARDHIELERAGEPVLWPRVAHSDTIYLCVVDAAGNAVSFINSLFHQFGSGIMAPDAGYLFQNRGAQFSLEFGHPNVIEGGKRPLHTIIPGMLMRNGETIAPFGVMGGQYQAAGHVQLLSNIIDRGLDVQQALEAPRSFAYEGYLDLETEFSDSVARDLARRGHRVRTPAEPLGGAQIIWIDHERGVLAGGSEPRKDGMALGF